jgi:hypothetical protein
LGGRACFPDISLIFSASVGVSPFVSAEMASLKHVFREATEFGVDLIAVSRSIVQRSVHGRPKRRCGRLWVRFCGLNWYMNDEGLETVYLCVILLRIDQD